MEKWFCRTDAMGGPESEISPLTHNGLNINAMHLYNKKLPQSSVLQDSIWAFPTCGEV